MREMLVVVNIGGGPTQIVAIIDAILARSKGYHLLLSRNHGLQTCFGAIKSDLTDLNASHLVLLNCQRGTSVQWVRLESFKGVVECG